MGEKLLKNKTKEASGYITLVLSLLGARMKTWQSWLFFLTLLFTQYKNQEPLKVEWVSFGNEVAWIQREEQWTDQKFVNLWKAYDDHSNF